MRIDILKLILDDLIGLAWPLIVGYLLFSYREAITNLIDIAIARVQRGDEVKVGLITIGQSVGELKLPTPTDYLTDDHVALIHRSWRVPKRDAEFRQKMHQIHVIVFGTPEALKRIDYVIYRLDIAYPNPVRPSGPLETNFELKELANGCSLIRAEVYVRGQQEPVRLSRLIDLTDESPRLKGIYQKMAAK